MYTVSKPSGTIEINFENDEREILDSYAKWQGVESTFFLAIALQTTIRNICELFPQRLLMPGALRREIKKDG